MVFFSLVVPVLSQLTPSCKPSLSLGKWYRVLVITTKIYVAVLTNNCSFFISLILRVCIPPDQPTWKKMKDPGFWIHVVITFNSYIWLFTHGYQVVLQQISLSLFVLGGESETRSVSPKITQKKHKTEKFSACQSSAFPRMSPCFF